MKYEPSVIFNKSIMTTDSFTYADAVKQLQNCSSISLETILKLSYDDLNCLFEEIKRWSVYGRDGQLRHDPFLLRAERRR